MRKLIKSYKNNSERYCVAIYKIDNHIRPYLVAVMDALCDCYLQRVGFKTIEEAENFAEEQNKKFNKED